MLLCCYYAAITICWDYPMLGIPNLPADDVFNASCRHIHSHNHITYNKVIVKYYLKYI